MIGSCKPGLNPQYRQNFSVGIFQDLSTLEDFNSIVSMVKSDEEIPKESQSRRKREQKSLRGNQSRRKRESTHHSSQNRAVAVEKDEKKRKRRKKEVEASFEASILCVIKCHLTIL